MRRTLPILSLYLLVACASNAPQVASTKAPAATPSPLPKADNLPEAPLPAPGRAALVGLVDRAVTSFGAAALSEHVYTLGGYTGTPHEYVSEDQSDGFARYDLASDKWESLPSPGKSQSATLTSYAGRLIRVGGMRIENHRGEPTRLTSLTTVEVFDPQTSTWTAATPLPEARSSHATALVGSRLYVIGGWALNGPMDGARWADSMLVADLAQPTLQWTRVPMPFKSRALGAATLDRFIVTVGGMEGRRIQRLVHVFDTVSGTWAQGPELPEPGFGVAVTSDQNRVYASGASGKVYVLNPAVERWEVHGELVFPRFFHAALTTEDHRLLFFGGIPSDQAADRLRHIEELTATGAMFATWTVNNPSGAKNRQGIFALGNRLLTFGGNKALGQHDFAPENFLQVSFELDVGSLAWRPRAPFPNAGQSMQTVVTESGIGVALGGFGPSGATLAARKDAFQYDLEKDTWTPIPPLPGARTQFGFVEYDAKLWLFAGMDFDDSKSGDAMFSYPMEVLSRPVTDTSAFAPSGVQIQRPRRAFAGALLDDDYYMVGGMAGGFAPVSDCDAFNFTSKSWKAIACPSRVRIGAELVALNGKLYLLAGRSKSSADGDLSDDGRVEVYDPQTNTWSQLVDRLPIEDTHQLRAFALNNRILIYTGQRNDDRVQLVVFDPAGKPPAAQ